MGTFPWRDWGPNRDSGRVHGWLTAVPSCAFQGSFPFVLSFFSILEEIKNKESVTDLDLYHYLPANWVLALTFIVSLPSSDK